MKLIIGGAFQGKKKAAMTLTAFPQEAFLDGETCSMEEIFSCKGIFHFHGYLRRMMEENKETEGFLTELYKRNPEIVLISTELGYGIVPVDAFDREYREKVGRICCEAAEKSEKVYRVIAGIPVCIKGEPL
jgi:adenosylcobinamide kinase/adenosylcobinamide-phosphate guanylyltransferase